MKIAIEVIMFVIILFSAWTGYKKGLIMCIGTILAIIVAMYMGDLLSNTFSQEAVPVLNPFVSVFVEGQNEILDNEVTELLGDAASQLSVEDAIAQHPEIVYQLCENCYTSVGIYGVTAKTMANEAVALSNKSDGKISVSIITVLCEKLAYVIGFVLFFIIIFIILVVLGNIFNLSFKIPGMNKLNDIGGITAGFIYGIMFCLLLAWVLSFMGMLIPEEEINSTVLAKIFTHSSLLSRFL